MSANEHAWVCFAQTMPLFIIGLRSEEIKERVKNSLGGSMEEMLRAEGFSEGEDFKIGEPEEIILL